jgi:hypothetical protein
MQGGLVPGVLQELRTTVLCQEAFEIVNQLATNSVYGSALAKGRDEATRELPYLSPGILRWSDFTCNQLLKY